MYFFDLDGTLLDSNSIWLEIDIRFLGLHGIAPVPEDYTDYVTHHAFADAAEYTRQYFGLPLSAGEIVAAWHELALSLIHISPPQIVGGKGLPALPAHQGQQHRPGREPDGQQEEDRHRIQGVFHDKKGGAPNQGGTKQHGLGQPPHGLGRHKHQLRIAK